MPRMLAEAAPNGVGEEEREDVPRSATGSRQTFAAPRALLTCMLAAVVALCCQATPAENLALGAEAVGLCRVLHVPWGFGANSGPEKAVDGDPTTAARFSQAFPWYIEVRLGEAQAADRIVLLQAPNGVSQHYQVRVSGDGYVWETLAEVSDDPNTRREFAFTPRWVSRVQVISLTPTEPGSSVGCFAPAEVEVLRSEQTPPDPKPVLLPPLPDAPPDTYRPRYPLGAEQEDLDAPAPRWLLDTFRRAHCPVDVDLLADERKRTDFVARCAKSGMKLFASKLWDHEFAFYPSDLAPLHPSLRGKGDPLRALIADVHAHGMRYEAYVCPSTSVRNTEHLRWAERQFGELQINVRFYEGCWASPYVDFLIDRLVEAARRYPIDAFWFDGFHIHNGGACDYCRAKFERETGRAFPRGIDWEDPSYLAWAEWRQRQVSEAVRRVRRALAEVRPELTFITNTYNTQQFPLVLPWSSSYEARFMPSVSEEHGLTYVQDMTYHHFMANYVRSLAGDNRDGELWLYQGQHANVPLVDLRLRALTQIAAGDKPCLAAEAGGWGRLKAVYDDIEAREPWLVGAKRVKWAALLVSDRMKYFDAARRTKVGWQFPPVEDQRYIWSYERGLYRAMVEAHLPVTMVTDVDLEQGRLDGYRVLLLGNATCLTDEACAAIRRFVQSGGGLVATHGTGALDGWGVPRTDLALADLFGCSQRGRGEASGQVRLEPSAPRAVHVILDQYLHRSIKPGDHSTWLPWRGPLVQVEAKDGSQTLATLDTDQGGWPLALQSRYGRGRVFYFPAAVDYTLFNSSTPWGTPLIAWAAREAAAAAPPVEASAPAIVSVTAFDQPEEHRLVVHLLNDYSSQGRVPAGGSWTRRDSAVLADLEVTVRGGPFSRANLEPGHDRLRMARHGPDWVISVPRLDMHRMVVVDY